MSRRSATAMIASVAHNRTSRMPKVKTTRPSQRLRRWSFNLRSSSESRSCADGERWESGSGRSVGVVR